MADAFAVLCCFVGYVVILVALQVFRSRGEPSRDDEAHSSSDDWAGMSPWAKLAVILAFVLKPSMFLDDTKSGRLDWVTATLVLILLGALFIVGGIYIGFTEP